VRAVLAGVALAAVLVTRPARPADLLPPLPPDVRAHYESAMEHYAAKEYEAALRELAVAYAAEPRREILFAQAQATRLGGDCAAALPLYEKFLATSPPARQVEATRIAVARCTDAVAKVPPKEAPRTPEAPAATAPVTGALAAVAPSPGIASLTPRVPPGPALGLEQRTPPPAPSRRWYRDPVAGALAGAAIVTASVGVGFLVSAQGEDATAREMMRLGLDSYADHRVRAEGRNRWGLAGMLVGGALAVGAAGRYLWLGLGDGGRGLTAQGRF
jgi:hypothetical protein